MRDLRYHAAICFLALSLCGCAGRTEESAPVDRAPWLAALNRARAKAGSPPFSLSAALTQAAQEQAEAMASEAGEGHALRSPTTSTVAQMLARVGYPAAEWTESFTLSSANADAGAPASPEPGLDLKTFGAALDGPYRDVGMGFAYSQGSVLRVFLFGRRKDEQFVEATAGLADRARVERELLALVNSERGRIGVAPLTLDPLLSKAAQGHAEDMLARGYFAHQSPEGSGPAERARAAGYGEKETGGAITSIGENIAEQQFSAKEVVQAWMDSPPHRRNMLDPNFKEMGLGLALGPPTAAGEGGRRALWVLTLGRRRIHP